MRSKSHNHSFLVAIVGSSGGGSASLFDVNLVVLALVQEFSKIDVTVSRCLLITSSSGFDFSSPDSEDISLWILENENKPIICKAQGSLRSVNHLLADYDLQLSEDIRKGKIDAIVSVSSDPAHANRASFEAAIDVGIPIVGTGGSSLSYIQCQGGNVIGASGGSVCTTPETRAICFVASLANQWGKAYQTNTRGLHFVKFRSVVGAAMPFIICAAVLRAAIETILPFTAYAVDQSFLAVVYRGLSGLSEALQNRLIPVVVGALASSESSGSLREAALLAGAAAGSIVAVGDCSLLMAYLAGCIVSMCLPRLLQVTARYSLLPTASTIIALGLSAAFGGATGILGGYALSSIVELSWRAFIELVNSVPHYYYNYLLMAAGGIGGFAVSLGSELGYYHTHMLPVIAFEMQRARFSIAGAFDVVCLCAPCAGVCAGVWLRSAHGTRHERLGRRGMVANFFMGDFVEACYPYTLKAQLSSRLLLLAVRCSCVLAGALIVLGGLATEGGDNGICPDIGVCAECKYKYRPVASSAYMPLPLSIAFSVSRGPGEDSIAYLFFGAAVSVTFTIPFLFSFFVSLD